MLLLILLQLKTVIGGMSYSPFTVGIFRKDSFCAFPTFPSPSRLAELGGENRIYFCEFGDSCDKVQIGHGQFGVVCYQFRQYALVSCGNQ